MLDVGFPGQGEQGLERPHELLALGLGEHEVRPLGGTVRGGERLEGEGLVVVAAPDMRARAAGPRSGRASGLVSRAARRAMALKPESE